MKFENILDEYFSALAKGHELEISKAESIFIGGGTFVLVLQPTKSICIPVNRDNVYEAIDRFIVSTSGIVNIGDLSAIKIFICDNGSISRSSKDRAFEFLRGLKRPHQRGRSSMIFT